MPDELNAVITQRTEVSPGLFIIRVVPDGWELDGFIPGQYGVLGLPGSAPRCEGSDPEEEPGAPEKLIKRAYSIASSSLAKEFLEFYIVLVPGGALTPRLYNLQIGDRVWLGHKITGMFTLDSVPEDQNLILIATGTGLAPYISMLRSQLTVNPDRKFGILHGARHTWELGYRSELMALDDLYPNFTYVPSISRPQLEPIEWKGETGHIQNVWSRSPFDSISPTPENTHIFLCGNPAMIETMLERLDEEGFVEQTRKQAGQIHVEKYW